MPYFFIVPGVVVLVAMLLLAALASYFMAGWRHLSAYFVASAVGALLGFVVANVLLVLVGFGTLEFLERLQPSNWLRQAGGFATVAGLLVGPFIATASGVAVGAGTGVFLVFRRRSRRAV